MNKSAESHIAELSFYLQDPDQAAAIPPGAPSELTPITSTTGDASQGTSFVYFAPSPSAVLQMPGSAPEDLATMPISDSGSTFAVLPQPPVEDNQQVPDSASGTVLTAPVPAPSPPESNPPPAEATSSAPGTTTEIQCTATVVLGSNWSSSAGVSDQAANFYIKNLGAEAIDVPYAISVTIPGVLGTSSSW